MTRNEFEELSCDQGYDEPKLVSFEPLSRSETHSHDKISFVYVLEGEFILNTSEGAPRYRPGDTCLLDKDIDHAEEAGPEGATILVARK
jgi:quercetin dioxygenase-like cupin family protein